MDNITSETRTSMTRGAEFSSCGKYRYQLYRIWGDGSGKVAMCIGLNPSRAGETKDDPTMRWLINALQAHGYDGVRMTNLYALVSSRPGKLFEVADPQCENDSWLKATAFICQEIVYCYGTFKGIEYRARKVREMFPGGKCFGKNADGSPWHPLALMYKGIKPADALLMNF